jgi:hypothetical protein
MSNNDQSEKTPDESGKRSQDGKVARDTKNDRRLHDRRRDDRRTA